MVVFSTGLHAVRPCGLVKMPLEMQQFCGELLGLDLQAQQDLFEAGGVGVVGPILRVAIQRSPVFEKPNVQLVGEGYYRRSALAGGPMNRHAELQLPALRCPRTPFEVRTDLFPAV